MPCDGKCANGGHTPSSWDLQPLAIWRFLISLISKARAPLSSSGRQRQSPFLPLLLLFLPPGRTFRLLLLLGLTAGYVQPGPCQGGWTRRTRRPLSAGCLLLTLPTHMVTTVWTHLWGEVGSVRFPRYSLSSQHFPQFTITANFVVCFSTGL